MSKPGYEWRVLAHYDDGSKSFDVHSAEYQRKNLRNLRRMWKGQPEQLAAALKRHEEGTTVFPAGCCFDEVAMISPDIHLEQMDERVWWISLGDYHFWLTVKGGKTIVTHDGAPLETYGITPS